MASSSLPSHAVLALVLMIGFVGCTSSTGLRPVHELKNYTDLSSRPFLERIVPMPAILLDNLRQVDSRPDYQPYQPTKEERTLIAECLARLPGPLKAAIDSEVIGVSFLEGFAGGAMTHDLYGQTQKDWLIFNPRLLRSTLSEWLTFRDGTAFEQSRDYLLREETSRELSAFQGILIHESAHVFDFLHHVTRSEDWWAKPLPHYGHQDELHFYNFSPEPKVPASDLPAVFEGLAESGFASLYASQNNLDEWAERVTYGVLRRDFGVEVTLTLVTPQGTRIFVPTRATKAKDRMGVALTLLDSM